MSYCATGSDNRRKQIRMEHLTPTSNIFGLPEPPWGQGFVPLESDHRIRFRGELN